MRTCPACGEENTDRARFCQACGASLEAIAPLATEERKLVTVLFADVTDSTGLGERLDPERLEGVMRSYFAVMRREIEAEGGTVEKFIGDAIVAAFGVPITHDDDTSRALRAALRMRHALSVLNTSLAKTQGVTLRVRIGVNTGEALTAVTPRPGEPLATGDVMNVAARLQQAAEPGEVLVAERTARATRGFSFAEPSVRTLRGRDATASALRLLGTVDDAERGLPGIEVPMVGRDRELSMLTALYERVASERRSHLVTLYGDAGVGKSRLIRELVAAARAQSLAPTVVRGRCLPYGEGVTYWPLAEILKQQAGILDTHPPDVALGKLRDFGAALITNVVSSDPARATAALGHTIGIEDPDHELGALPPRQVHSETHAAWRSFFSALAAERPAVVIVEDIHWADMAMLDLLEELADRVPAPVLFVCPSRPELSARRSGWGGGRLAFSSFLLEPLSPVESDRLVNLLLEVEDLPAAVHAAIIDRAEGNPFFIEEIVRKLFDEGHIIRDGPRWTASPDVSSADIPDTVQGVLAARLDLLEPVQKRAVQMAAVVGRVFWTGAVERLLGGESADIDAIMRVLQDRELVVERLGSTVSGEREYSFKHVLTRDVAYESLPRRERSRVHTAVAEWIEETAGARRAEFIELLAHHYAEAYAFSSDAPPDSVDVNALRRQALDELGAAAQAAAARFALDTARRLSDRAVVIAATERERVDTLAVRGQVAIVDNRGDDVWDSFREAVDLMLSVAPDEHATIAQLCADAVEIPIRHPGMLTRRAPIEDVMRYMDIGFQHVGDSDSVTLARLLAIRGFIPHSFALARRTTADQSADVEAAERAAAMAERLGRLDIASAALDAVMSIHLESGDYRAQRPILERRLVMAPRIRNEFELADIYNMAAWTALALGDYRDALRWADAGYEQLSPEARTTTLATLPLPWRVIVKFRLGDWDASLADHRLVEEALGERRDTPTPFMARHVGAVAYLHELRGDVVEADRIIDMVEKRLGVPEADRITLSWAAPWLARIYARRRRLDLVDDMLREERALRGLGWFLEGNCDAVAELERWDVAASVSERARSLAVERELRALVPYADRLDGRAALARGDAGTARALLQNARDAFTDLGARWEAAWTELWLAEALLVAGELGATREAATHADTVFRELGSVREHDHAASLLERVH